MKGLGLSSQLFPCESNFLYWHLQSKSNLSEGDLAKTWKVFIAMGPKVYKTPSKALQSKVIGSYRLTGELIEGKQPGFSVKAKAETFVWFSELIFPCTFPFQCSHINTIKHRYFKRET